MGLGLLLSAISGAGQGAGESLAQSQRFDQEQDLMKQKSDLDAAKAIQVAQATQANAAALADTQREQMNSRIAAAASPYLQQATLANAMADKGFTGGAGATFSDLTDDQKAQYAPTSAQQLNAYVAGAKDTGDLAPQGLLNAQLSDQANQRMIDAQKAQLAQQYDLAQAQMKNSKDIAGMYAARNGGGNSLDPLGTFNLSAGREFNAQARELDIRANDLAKQLRDINPRNSDGSPNPDYLALSKQIGDVQAQADDQRRRAMAAMQSGSQRVGMTPAEVDAIYGSGGSPSAAPAPQGIPLYDPKSGKFVPIGVPAQMPQTAPLRPGATAAAQAPRGDIDFANPAPSQMDMLNAAAGKMNVFPNHLAELQSATMASNAVKQQLRDAISRNDTQGIMQYSNNLKQMRQQMVSAANDAVGAEAAPKLLSIMDQ